MSERLFKALHLILLLAWVVALFLPVAIMGGRPEDDFPGWGILAMGWMGVWVFQFGWFANFTAITALLMGWKGGRTCLPNQRGVIAALAFANVVLGIWALFWRDMYGSNEKVEIPQFGAGYYLWFIVVFGAAILSIMRLRAGPAEGKEPIPR